MSRLLDCAVFDFDRTLTDVERHAPAFHDASREALARLLGCGRAEVERMWDEIETEHRTAPPEMGWSHDGHVVGPARADPYLVANAIVRAILERRGFDDPGPMVFGVHRTACERVAPPFREDACWALDEAESKGALVCVVTNSATDTVASRLDGLGLRCRERVVVRGHARKFVIGGPGTHDPAFDALPESIMVAGLNRPILLRRGPYFDVLRQIWGSTGAAERTLVVGDLFELDLAMPSVLGCAVHLVTRRTTMAHERQAVLGQPRGAAGDSLADVVARW